MTGILVSDPQWQATQLHQVTYLYIHDGMTRASGERVWRRTDWTDCGVSRHVTRHKLIISEERQGKGGGEPNTQAHSILNDSDDGV
jgi:hypothetical protein